MKRILYIQKKSKEYKNESILNTFSINGVMYKIIPLNQNTILNFGKIKTA